MPIRFGDLEFDALLPGDVPLSQLLPTLSDLAVAHGGPATARPTRVSTVRGPLDAARTLHDLGVADGTLLFLHHHEAVPLTPADTDAAETVARERHDAPALGAVMALALVGVGASAALPDADGTARALLSAAAVCAAAVTAARLVPAIAPVTLPAAVAAAVLTVVLLPATVITAPLPDVAVVSSAVAVSVSAGAARIAAAVTHRSTDTLTVHRRLVSGAAVAAGVSALVVAIGGGPPRVLFAALTLTAVIPLCLDRLRMAANAALVMLLPAAGWLLDAYGDLL